MKDSKFFSIMADEGTSHSNKVCAFCITFIAEDNNVREEFIDFVPSVGITGETIATALK